MHEFCFYLDWPGWKPEVWAAWAQAILSAAAVFLAARFAQVQQAAATLQKVEAIERLLGSASSLIEVELAIMRDLVGQDGIWDQTSPLLLDLRGAIAAIQPHELPEADLIHPVLMAGRGLDGCIRCSNDAVDSSCRNEPLTSALLSDFERHSNAVFVAHKTALGVVSRCRRSTRLIPHALLSWLYAK